MFASVSVDTCLQCFKVCMVQNLSNMWGLTLKIDTAQSGSFTETAPKFTVLICEKRPRGGCRICFRRGCTRLLLYFNANKPHRFFLFFFFFCKIPVVLENRRSSQRGETPCTLPLDPPLRPYPVWLSCRRKSYPVKQAASGVWTWPNDYRYFG